MRAALFAHLLSSCSSTRTDRVNHPRSLQTEAKKVSRFPNGSVTDIKPDEQSSNRVVRGYLVGKLEKAPQPLQFEVPVILDVFSGLAPADNCAHGEHHDVDEFMPPIAPDPWILELYEIVHD